MKTTENKTGKFGKYLLIIGIAALLGLLMEILGVFDFDLDVAFGLPLLLMGWLLVIGGAISISLRTTAWTFFLMGIYLYFYVGELFKRDHIYTYAGFVPLLVVVVHLFLGLILIIISFVSHRKKVKKSTETNSSLTTE